MILISIISRPYQDWLIKFVFISHLFHLINFPFGNINMYTIQELNKFLRLQIFKKGIGIWHLFATEARLALSCCCCAPPAAPSKSTRISHYLLLKLHFTQQQQQQQQQQYWLHFNNCFLYICFSITSLKITVHYQIIINIKNSVSNMAYFLSNTKTWHYTFSEGRKPDFAPNMTKFPILTTCWNCQPRL